MVLGQYLTTVKKDVFKGRVLKEILPVILVILLILRNITKKNNNNITSNVAKLGFKY